jgi:hypothetical protein
MLGGLGMLQLKMLREHYQSNDGQNWTPKQQFDNEDEIRETGLLDRLWRSYRCSLCDKLHVVNRKKYDVKP